MSDEPTTKPTPDDKMGHGKTEPPAQPVDVGAQEDAAKDRAEGGGYD